MRISGRNNDPNRGYYSKRRSPVVPRILLAAGLVGTMAWGCSPRPTEHADAHPTTAPKSASAGKMIAPDFGVISWASNGIVTINLCANAGNDQKRQDAYAVAVGYTEGSVTGENRLVAPFLVDKAINDGSSQTDGRQLAPVYASPQQMQTIRTELSTAAFRGDEKFTQNFNGTDAVQSLGAVGVTCSVLAPNSIPVTGGSDIKTVGALPQNTLVEVTYTNDAGHSIPNLNNIASVPEPGFPVRLTNGWGQVKSVFVLPQ